MQQSELPQPPLEILQGAALFLDFDGTLVELAETPDAILVPPELGPLLGRLSARLDGRLALVSGRSISDLERYLPCSGLAVAGSHGLELRLPGGAQIAPPPVPGLSEATEATRRFAEHLPGAYVEEKPHGIGLHYRRVPEAAERVRAFMEELALSTGLNIQSGKELVELRPGGADKGDAVRAFMTEPKFQSARPVFVGDDVTDEDAFAAAAALGGGGALVGLPRPTAARWRLGGVADVARWLSDFAGERA